MMSAQFECPVCGHKKGIPTTNADRIRAMSDEGLAQFIADIDPKHCRLCPAEYLCTGCTGSIDCAGFIERWLQQPAEVE